MAFRITNEWIIGLPEDFENRVEDEKLIFWKTGITVIVAAFKTPEGVGKLELLNKVQTRMPENRLETFVSTKGEIVGLGYTQIEALAEDKKRLSLYTFTASETSFLQIAFYLDDPKNLEWAKSMWENIVFTPDKANQTQA